MNRNLNMGKNRLEAFTDGVLAIVITIMVLELKLPEGDSWADFIKVTPMFFGYALSFLFISIYWLNHHLMLNKTERINVRIIWYNMGWLFVLSFIPFTTKWLGAHPMSPIPVILYFGVMFLAAVMFHIEYYLIAVENGKKDEFKMRAINILSLLSYLLATAFGFFSPIAAYIVVAAVTILWMIPQKRHNDNVITKNNKNKNV